MFSLIFIFLGVLWVRRYTLGSHFLLERGRKIIDWAFDDGGGETT